MKLHVHLIGVGGAGMSALARLYLATGAIVSGTDAMDSPVLDDLRALGAQVSVGHAAEHVVACLSHGSPPFRLVVASSAIPADNPELVAAHASGTATFKHAEALASFVNDRRGIAVAGTHGKTTTTAMTTLALRAGGVDPSFLVGGELVDLGTSAGMGSSDWMVVEADEFDRRFLAFTPEIAVVTNVEPEHFECYPTVDDMDDAFVGFLERVKVGGAVIASRGAGLANGAQLERLLDRADCAMRRHGGPVAEVIRYATEASAHVGDWTLGQFHAHGVGSRFVVTPPRGTPIRAHLVVPGEHNAMNALAASVAATRAGVAPDVSLAALASFGGVKRRFQVIADGPIRVVEDYAHHPTEVRVTLAAARAIAPSGRLWAVFQPHLRVRTDRLFDDFVAVLATADCVVLADVYSPAGREPDGEYPSSADLIAALRMSHPGISATYAPSDDAVLRAVIDHARAGDLIVVMGAGPIDRVGHEIARSLRP
jgi:UDP-N-acetylmuramate--alanine ligase